MHPFRHHRYFTINQHHQLYQLSQLAVSMTVDLNLPNFHLASLQEAGFSSLRQSSRYWDEIERIRTFLGCYFLSSS